MISRRAAAAALASFLAAILPACSHAPALTGAAARERLDSARAAYERLRVEAWSPRRFKALFRGEVSPNVGAVARGYLSVFWDGAVLEWRTSAPIAGRGKAGAIRRGTPAPRSELPLPGAVSGDDVLAVLLGAPHQPCCTGEASIASGLARLPIDGEGRAALVDVAGRLVGLELPGGLRASFDPGAGVPRRIEAVSREGRALLTLESYGPWPEGDEAPPRS